ncbi:MAG: hypothetical protein H6868_04930 [Rhodospirillales bacterium]|nr:hypothetical protein [Rhodospirillales bacterium]
MASDDTDLDDLFLQILETYNDIAQFVPQLVFEDEEGLRFTLPLTLQTIQKLCDDTPVLDCRLVDFFDHDARKTIGSVPLALKLQEANIREQKDKDYLMDMIAAAEGLYDQQLQARVDEYIRDVPKGQVSEGNQTLLMTADKYEEKGSLPVAAFLRKAVGMINDTVARAVVTPLRPARR